MPDRLRNFQAFALRRISDFVASNPTARRGLEAFSEFAGKALSSRTRRFEGAKRGRRTDGWYTPGEHPNQSIPSDLPTLRNRSQDLFDNNPYARRLIDTHVAAIVGLGIRPRATTGDKKLDKIIDTVFINDFIRYSEADGSRLGYYGGQRLACHAWLMGGEVFSRRRARRLEDGLPVPVQFELVRSQRVDLSRDEQRANGGRIVNGVELDPLGRIAGYHVFKEDPANGFDSFLTETGFVPHADMAHLYDPVVPGQRRGVPIMAPVIMALRDFDDYMDAKAVRNKAEATLLMTVTGAEFDTNKLRDRGYVGNVAVDAAGRPIETMSPGTVMYLQDGQAVQFNEPKAAGGIQEYSTVMLRRIAVGGGLTYEILAGDLSGVNYSSIKAGLIIYHRYIKIRQCLLFIPMLVQPQWEWFCTHAQAVRKIPTGVIPAKFGAPRLESVDRYKEAMADLAELKIGARSLLDVIAEKGGDPEDVLGEIAATNDMLEELGLKFDWSTDAGEDEDEDEDKNGEEKDKAAARGMLRGMQTLFSNNNNLMEDL